MTETLMSTNKLPKLNQKLFFFVDDAAQNKLDRLSSEIFSVLPNIFV
jgi:hypothetical protein